MRLPALPALLALLSCLSLPLHAEVKQASPDSLLITDSRLLRLPPAPTYAAITRVAHWWNSAHTWSGDAANLSLQAIAGGCFCERWNGNSVQHMRVLWASPGETLRLEGALGPLQDMALNGVMSFILKPEAGGTRLDFQYRVNGAASSGLDKLASPVNQVLMEQLGRLQRYAETGKVDAPKP